MNGISFLRSNIKKFVYACFITGLMCLLSLKALAGPAFFDTTAVKSHASVIRYIEYMTDPQGNISMEKLFSSELSNSFQPLTDSFPLTYGGHIWLRFTLSPISESAPKNELFLDLGSDTPKGSVLYYPQINDNETPSIWQGRKAESNGLFKLPAPSLISPVTVYVHIPGTPGLWFNPTVKTASEANQNRESVFFYFSISVLTVLLAICLLKAFRDGGEWRLWTAVLIALILAQAIMLDMPPLSNGHISFSGLLNVILPALSLMLLPHIARHLFDTPHNHKTMDTALIALSIAGGLICLIPLLPGCSSVIRLIPLWPILGIICAVPALLFLKRNQAGAAHYAWGCILLSIFSLISLLGTTNLSPSSIFSAAPVWGGVVFTLLVGILPMKKKNAYPPAPNKHYMEKKEKGPALQINDLLDDASSPTQISNEKDTQENEFLENSLHIHMGENETNNKEVSLEKNLSISEKDMTTAVTDLDIQASQNLDENSDKDQTTGDKEKIMPSSPHAPYSLENKNEPFTGSNAQKDELENSLSKDIAEESHDITINEKVSPSSIHQTEGTSSSTILQEEISSQGKNVSAEEIAADNSALKTEQISSPEPQSPKEEEDLLEKEKNSEDLTSSIPAADTEKTQFPEPNMDKKTDIIDWSIFSSEEKATETENEDFSSAEKDLSSGTDKVSSPLLIEDTHESDEPRDENISKSASLQNTITEGSEVNTSPFKAAEVPSASILSMAKNNRSEGKEHFPNTSSHVKEHVRNKTEVSKFSSPWAKIINEEATHLDPSALAKIEECIKVPLESLIQAASELNSCSLPPIARVQSETITKTSAVLSELVNALTASTVPETNTMQEDESENKNITFDLQVILREVHNAVASKAERRGLALSWFMPPHLPPLYKGNPAQLQSVLHLLLDSAIESTYRGTVQMAVRRVPDSIDPGHLIFTVTDNGQTSPSLKSSTAALMKAWELIIAQGGTLSLDSIPNKGTVVSFTLHLATPEKSEQERLSETKETTAGNISQNANTLTITPLQPSTILVISEETTDRQLLSFFINDMPYSIKEARSVEEAMALYAESPMGLIFIDYSLPDLNLSSVLEEFHNIDTSLNIPPVPVVAIVQDHDDIPATREAGCAAAIRKPLSRSRVRDSIISLLPLSEDEISAISQKSPIQDNSNKNELHPVSAYNETEYNRPNIQEKQDEAPQAREDKRNLDSSELEASIDRIFKGEFKKEEDKGIDKNIVKLVDEIISEDKTIHSSASDMQEGKNTEHKEEDEEVLSEFQTSDYKSEHGAGLAATARRFMPRRRHSKTIAPTMIPSPKISHVGEPRPRYSTPVLTEEQEEKHKDQDLNSPITKDIPKDIKEKTIASAHEEANGTSSKKQELDGMPASEMGLGETISEKRINEEEKRTNYIKIPEKPRYNDEIDPDIIYLIPGLLESLDGALKDAYTGRDQGSFLTIAEACVRLSGTAEAHNLQTLRDIAGCVERAANANDMESVNDLLDELAASVQSNREKLEAIYSVYTKQNG